MVFSVIRENSSLSGPMSQTYSEDGGQKWEPVRSLGLKCHLPFTGITQLANGQYLGVYQRYGMKDRTGAPDTIWQAISEDGGLSWGEPTLVWEDNDRSPAEPEVIRSPEGQLLCLMRAKAERSLWTVSDNEGKCWSKAKETMWGLTGHRHRARYAPDGRLVVVLRDKATGSPYKDHFVAWVGSYDDIVQRSAGCYRVKLVHTHKTRGKYPRDCGYAGLELLPDGTFVATTYARYRRQHAGNSIVSVRFKLDELDEKAKRQG